MPVGGWVFAGIMALAVLALAVSPREPEGDKADGFFFFLALSVVAAFIVQILWG
jgi:hypothetical protein